MLQINLKISFVLKKTYNYIKKNEFKCKINVDFLKALN